MDRHRRHFPFGAEGYNPAGVRIGQEEPQQPRHQGVGQARVQESRRQGRARHAQHQDRAKRLSRFAREGAPDELDLDNTIKGTAHKGYLDIHMRPERRNTIKVLLFLDVGGSMDGQISEAEELFSAARTEFKHLDYFYFHNFIYEPVWKDNAPTLDGSACRPGRCCTITRRLQGDLRRRRSDDSLRDLRPRRRRRAHERGAGRLVDEARHRHLPARRVAEPPCPSRTGAGPSIVSCATPWPGACTPSPSTASTRPCASDARAGCRKQTGSDQTLASTSRSGQRTAQGVGPFLCRAGRTLLPNPK